MSHLRPIYLERKHTIIMHHRLSRCILIYIYIYIVNIHISDKCQANKFHILLYSSKVYNNTCRKL